MGFAPQHTRVGCIGQIETQLNRAAGCSTPRGPRHVSSVVAISGQLATVKDTGEKASSAILKDRIILQEQPGS